MTYLLSYDPINQTVLKKQIGAEDLVCKLYLPEKEARIEGVYTLN